MPVLLVLTWARCTPGETGVGFPYALRGGQSAVEDRPEGQTIQHVYDALYRMTQKSYPDSTAVEYAITGILAATFAKKRKGGPLATGKSG